LASTAPAATFDHGQAATAANPRRASSKRNEIANTTGAVVQQQTNINRQQLQQQQEEGSNISANKSQTHSASEQELSEEVNCVAKFNYIAGQRDGDTTLTRGDEIIVIDRSDKNGQGWWKGTNKNTNETGFFPAAYVKLKSDNLV
jgi:hypothetical protein